VLRPCRGRILRLYLAGKFPSYTEMFCTAGLQNIWFKKLFCIKSGLPTCWHALSFEHTGMLNHPAHLRTSSLSKPHPKQGRGRPHVVMEQSKPNFLCTLYGRVNSIGDPAVLLRVQREFGCSCSMTTCCLDFYKNRLSTSPPPSTTYPQLPANGTSFRYWIFHGSFVSSL
jgi:hypothetical protein